MGNELQGIYYILGEKYSIYACWDKETPEYEIDFYDVFDKDGTCINEGEPFWEFPTYKELREYVTEFINN